MLDSTTTKIARDFPCKKCGHQAIRHFANISLGDDICLDCVTGGCGTDDEEHWHDFEGDNLKYMELQIKRQELRNE